MAISRNYKSKKKKGKTGSKSVKYTRSSTCSYDTSITPSLSVSSLLKDSVNDLSNTQHWIKSSNFIELLSARSNRRVHN